MSGTLEYRVRIRNASTLANPDGTTDDLVLSSQSGGTNPYLTEAPSGDGQQLDPISGAVSSGTYRVVVADPITAGTDRLITQKLEDATRRQQLLSRRTYIEFRENGGAWTALFSGYITALRLVDAITWQIDVGDTRRVERTKRLFERSSTQFSKRGCISGGPIIGGWGPVTDLGGWVVQVTNVASTYVSLKFISGYATPDFRTTSKLADVVDRANDAAAAFAVFQDHWAASGSPTFVGIFDKLVARITDLSGALVGGVGGNGLFAPLAAMEGDGTVLWASHAPDFALTVSLRDGAVSPGAPGTKLKVSIYADPVSDASPLYLIGHPADVVAECYANAGVTIDATSVTAVRATMGDNLRVSLRLTESQEFDAFLRAALLGPFGLAVRVAVSGTFELTTTRIKTTSVPAQTINTSDLRSGDPSLFDLDESTAVSQVTVDTQAFSVAGYASPGSARFAVRKDSWPLDGVWVSDSSVQVQSADYTTFGQRQETYTLPGMVHDATSFASNPSALVSAIANEIFDRYGRGAIGGEVRVLRASGITAQPGDEVYVQPGHLPNANKRYADDPTVGARIMQVVKRTETPEGPDLQLLDSGTNAQPVVPAAAVTIAASASFPRRVAQFTITNAAAINATGVLQVAVEWATGSSAPASNGNSAVRYEPSACATGVVDLPAVAPGTTVRVRARTEQAGRRPSAWGAWSAVTLTAATAPSGLTTSLIRQNAATLTWTNGAATDPVGIYVYEGGSAPADWSASLVTVLPAGSTTAKVRNLNGPTITHQVAAAHLYADGSRSAFATTSFATNSTLDSAPRPAGLQVISSTTPDASQRTGVALAVWASDPTCDLEIERAPDSAGSPGTFARIVTVPGSTKVWVDDLPTDGAQRWYRIRHALSGMTSSSYTGNVSGTPGNIPERLDQPDPAAPVIARSTFLTQGVATGTMQLTTTDPQSRVDIVTARTKVDPGAWSGFATVVISGGSYTQTVSIPAIGFGWVNMRVYGYDGAGSYVVLFDDTAAFDASSTPNLVALEGSFLDSGTLLVRATADHDTQSLYCAVSTSGYPSDATVLASSPTDGRNVEFSFAGAYAIGTRVYISAIGAASTGGGGVVSPTFQISIIRGNDASSKTIRIAAAGLLDMIQPTASTLIPLWDAANGYPHFDGRQLDASSGIIGLNADAAFVGTLPVPKGGTLSAIRAQTYVDGGDGAGASVLTVTLSRVEDSGTVTTLGSSATHTADAAWSTQTVGSLSESTAGSRSYRVQWHCNSVGTSNNHDFRVMWVEYDFAAPNYNVTT